MERASNFAVFGIVPSITQTNAIVGELEGRRYDEGAVSVLLPERSSYDEGPRGAVARLPGLGRVVIAGLGPLLGAGDVIDALAVASPPTIACALQTMGMCADDAVLYEEKVRDGNILVVARANDAPERARAESVFHMAGAYDIVVAGAS